MVLVIVACSAPMEDVCVTIWNSGVAETIVRELMLFLEIEILVGRIHLAEYWVRTVRPRLELGSE